MFYGALQPGQKPQEYTPAITIKRKQGGNPNVPDAYIVEAGNYREDFGTDRESSIQEKDRLMKISNHVQQFPTVEAAVTSTWNWLSAQPDNPLTKQELTDIITHLKKK